MISFESDETGVFDQWPDFENIGIWASDAYHHDGADVWSAMRNMTGAGVPEAVQHKLLGSNAATWYGIEPKMFVTDEAGPIERPDWFPQGPELDEWADLVAHPRENSREAQGTGLRHGEPGRDPRRRQRSAAGSSLLMAEVVDVDSHVYEPAAVWDDYVPAADRDRVRQAFSSTISDDGTVTTTLNGQAAKNLNRTRLVRQAIWRPGLTIDEIGTMDPAVFQPLNPGAWDPAARVADMDALGIDRAVVYPTLINEYLPQITDRDAAVLLCRAYNDWLWDFSEAAAGRLHPVAALPLQDPVCRPRGARPDPRQGLPGRPVPPRLLLVGGSQRGSSAPCCCR